MCAGRCAQLLNMNSIGNDVGIDHNTVSGWLSVLEASYISFLLRPHHKNFNKRLVKSPKLYFYDCGLICNLLNIEQAGNSTFHPLRGQIFESFVISELVKQRFHAGKQNNMYFWRDNVGHEIDCLYDFGISVFPVEIKSGSTVSSDYFKNIHFYQKINPSCKNAAVIYGGDKSYRQRNFYIISYKDIQVFESLDAECALAVE
jgi:predicted AAA+ superfamily ATPase